MGPVCGRVPREVAPKDFGRQNCVCSSTTLHKNYILLFCDLRKEEHRRFWKKKKEKQKKKKNSSRQKVHWVGRMKRYFKTYGHVEYFLPNLELFLNETAFYAKLAGQFSGPQIKVRQSIASKFGTNMQLFNLKMLSKFYGARSNRS